MEFTQEHFEVAGTAYFAAMDGAGLVVEPRAYPAAHDLAEAGWLERRFDSDGELVWHWTGAAETALDLHKLLDDHGQAAN